LPTGDGVPHAPRKTALRGDIPVTFWKSKKVKGITLVLGSGQSVLAWDVKQHNMGYETKKLAFPAFDPCSRQHSYKIAPLISNASKKWYIFLYDVSRNVRLWQNKKGHMNTISLDRRNYVSI
jgi:hypothetical protein